jgi:hypothetical protein
MTRLILSIVAGLVVTTILSTGGDHVFHVAGIYPPYGEPMLDSGLLLIAFSYRVVFEIFGSFLTAAIAGERAMKAVIILGTIGSAFWLAGAIVMWEFAQPWYNIAGVVTGIPLTWIGGKIYQSTLRKKALARS